MMRPTVLIVLSVLMLTGCGSHEQVEQVQVTAKEILTAVPGAKVELTTDGVKATLPKTTLAIDGQSCQVTIVKDGSSMDFACADPDSVTVFLRQIVWRETGNRGLGYGEIWGMYGYWMGVDPPSVVLHSRRGEALIIDEGRLLEWNYQGTAGRHCQQYLEWLMDLGVQGVARAAPFFYAKKCFFWK